MGLLNYTTRANLVANTPENINDINDCLDKIRVSVNDIDEEQLAANSVTAAKFDGTLAEYTGVNDGTTVRRGKSIIAASESRSSSTYGTLTTPDQVSNVVLPTDGLIFVSYQATWLSSATGSARASVFVGSTQLKVAGGAAAPHTQAAVLDNSYASDEFALGTFSGGLLSANAGTPNVDVTTGQVVGVNTFGTSSPKVEINGSTYQATGVGAGSPWWHCGGPCVIFAAAGTYTVSVQFKASSGSVTAKNRKLWVWTMGF